MSRSKGTGIPLRLRCAKCKVGTTRNSPKRGMNLEATGQVIRMLPETAVGRLSALLVEYRCKDCRHVGWSRHQDAERLWKKKFAATVAEVKPFPCGVGHDVRPYLARK